MASLIWTHELPLCVCVAGLVTLFVYVGSTKADERDGAHARRFMTLFAIFASCVLLGLTVAYVCRLSDEGSRSSGGGGDYDAGIDDMLMHVRTDGPDF
jgi:hypothetical protein